MIVARVIVILGVSEPVAEPVLVFLAMNANFARSYTPDHDDLDARDDKGDEEHDSQGSGDKPPSDENDKNTSSTSSTTTDDENKNENENMNMLTEDTEETGNWNEGGESEAAVPPSPSPFNEVEEVFRDVFELPAPTAIDPIPSPEGDHGPGDDAAGPPTNSPSNLGAVDCSRFA